MARPASVAYQSLPPNTVVWPVSQPEAFPSWPAKAPADTLDFTVDFGLWLSSRGLTITTVVVSATYGLTVSSATLDATNTKAIVTISGGIPDSTAHVKMLVSCINSRTLDVSIALRILPGLVNPVFVSGSNPDLAHLPDSFGLDRTSDIADYD